MRQQHKQALVSLCLLLPLLWVYPVLAAPGSSAPSSKQQRAVQLQTPALGQHRAGPQAHVVQNPGVALTDKALRLEATTSSDFGTLPQALGTESTTAVLFWTAAGVWALGNLVVLSGNIYALASGHGRLGWGITGIVLGGIGTVGSLIHIVSFIGLQGIHAGIMGVLLGIAAVHLANLALGIANVATRRVVRRGRGGSRTGPDVSSGHMQLTPWLTVGREHDLQGGLAITGTF